MKNSYSMLNKRAGNKLSNYLISMKEGEFDRKSTSFVAKLRAWFSKSQYVIFDGGENFQRNTNVGRNKLRNELGAIIFKNKQKKMSNMGPSDFENVLLGLPTVDTVGNVFEFKPLKAEDSMLHLLENEDYDPNIIKFEKKWPVWSDKKNSFVLNFGKRIKQASVKNTQLLKITKPGMPNDNQIYFQVSQCVLMIYSLEELMTNHLH